MKVKISCAMLLFALLPHSAHAQSVVRKTFSLLGGAAAGLAVHESGHVISSEIFDANPGVEPIHYAGIPFFAITHDHVTRKKRGLSFPLRDFGCSNAGSEWLLTAHPHLRDESAPFLKGVLVFNIATSAMYAAAAFGKLGPPQRDPRGMASSLGKTGWPEPIVGAFIIAPALLDGYRYFKPDQKWAAWTSRGAKAAFMALALFAGRS